MAEVEKAEEKVEEVQPDGLCLLRFSLRVSLNTSFRTFRQRNSIPARGNEISWDASTASP